MKISARNILYKELKGSIEESIDFSIKKVSEKFEDIKEHFIELCNKQGCLYEDDFHEACYDITDRNLMNKINTWLLSAGLPLKKNLPKCDLNKEETEYKKKIKEEVKHPNIKNIKSEKLDLYKLDVSAKKLKEEEEEFLPENEPLENKVFEQSEKKEKKAQRIEEEKKKLEDEIRTKNPPNAQSLLQKVRNALDFSELKAIWDSLFAVEEAPGLTHQFQEYVTFANKKFSVCIADTPEKKTAGLEIFDKLEEDHGMLFPFDPPSHVTFHMGSVKFPIDILFLMKTPFGLSAQKIIHNAQPGTDDLWSCSKIAYVLELPGGTCKKNKIRIGSTCTLFKE